MIPLKIYNSLVECTNKPWSDSALETLGVSNACVKCSSMFIHSTRLNQFLPVESIINKFSSGSIPADADHYLLRRFLLGSLLAMAGRLSAQDNGRW
ncbi:MAG TPA: hypothetical protein VN441_03275 [Syntrophomonas sp.]|nr:hypothetical protein [Syntrophomonas sp.]